MQEAGTIEAMPRTYEPGRQARRDIAEALARRWEHHEPYPTYEELAGELGWTVGRVRHHAEAMQDAELLHPGKLCLTEAGYEFAIRT